MSLYLHHLEMRAHYQRRLEEATDHQERVFVRQQLAHHARRVAELEAQAEYIPYQMTTY